MFRKISNQLINIKLRESKYFLRHSKLNDLYEKKTNKIFYDDVFLVSYPKSGNTWMRFLLTGMYLYILEKGNIKPNYYNIHHFVPDIHIANIDSYRPTPQLPRIIKSHREYTSNYPRVIYIVRDIRDVVISNYNFVNREKIVFGNFDSFIKNKYYGVPSWKRHVKSWVESNRFNQGKILLIKFEDLLEDSSRELEKVCYFLNLNISKEAINWSKQMANKTRMKNLEEKFSRPRTSTVPFIRKGEKGEWKEKLTEKNLEYITNNCESILKRLNYL